MSSNLVLICSLCFQLLERVEKCPVNVPCEKPDTRNATLDTGMSSNLVLICSLCFQLLERVEKCPVNVPCE